MKKSIKITALVLAAVLLTSCFLATTLAYYKTAFAAKNTDEARVAKWTFGSASVANFDLFTNTKTDENDPNFDLVKSTEDVVAPGMTGEDTIEFSNLTEAPEVAYKLEIEFAMADGFGSDLKNKIEVQINGGTWKKVSELSANDKVTKYFEAGTLPGDADAVTIGWRWVYGEADSVATDTALGSAGTQTAQLKVTVTATQLDAAPEENLFEDRS